MDSADHVVRLPLMLCQKLNRSGHKSDHYQCWLSTAFSPIYQFLGVPWTIMGFKGKKGDQDCPRFASLYIFLSSSSSSSLLFFYSFFFPDQLIPVKELQH